jgi:hypothetical protein
MFSGEQNGRRRVHLLTSPRVSLCGLTLDVARQRNQCLVTSKASKCSTPSFHLLLRCIVWLSFVHLSLRIGHHRLVRNSQHDSYISAGFEPMTQGARPMLSCPVVPHNNISSCRNAHTLQYRNTNAVRTPNECSLISPHMLTYPDMDPHCPDGDCTCR